jgi:hypothetical protein
MPRCDNSIHVYLLPSAGLLGRNSFAPDLSPSKIGRKPAPAAERPAWAGC